MKRLMDSVTVATFPGAKDTLRSISPSLPKRNEPNERVDEIFQTLARRDKMLPMRPEAVAAYQRGNVILLTEKQPFAKIPSFMPLFLMRAGGSHKAFVNASRHNWMRPGNERTLIGLLIAGMVYYKYAENHNLFTGRSGLLLPAAAVYARALAKALDRRFGVSMSAVAFAQIHYSLAKFFLIDCMGLEPGDDVDAKALKASPGVGAGTVQLIDASVPDAAYKGFPNYVEALKNAVPRLSKVTVRSVLREVAALYREQALPMVDYAPYLFANIVYHETTAGVTNEFSFESAMGRQDGMKAYRELAAAVRR